MSTSLEKSVNSKMLSIGGYLFIEGWASIARSQDQRSLSNIGRLGRMGIVKTAECCQYGYFQGDRNYDKIRFLHKRNRYS